MGERATGAPSVRPRPGPAHRVLARSGGHRWARTGPARSVDNGVTLAPDEVVLGPKSAAGPVKPADYPGTVRQFG